MQGAICRDVRLATRVMAHGDPRDPWWVPAAFDHPAGERPSIALTRDPHGDPLHAEIDAALTADVSVGLRRPERSQCARPLSQRDLQRRRERSRLAGGRGAGEARGRMTGRVQIIGRRFREDLILDAMEAVEARLAVMTAALRESLG